MKQSGEARAAALGDVTGTSASFVPHVTRMAHMQRALRGMWAE
jgi:hypothetical protein